MSELNALTKYLLSQGFSKDNPPSEVTEWSNFYGGWRYTVYQKRNIIIETPCGLIANASTIGLIDMSYMGTDWCLENDNAIIRCPFNKKDCDKRHSLLKDSGQPFCNTHIVQRSFDYDASVEKIREENRKLQEQRLKEFKIQKKNRVCEFQARYDEDSGRWNQKYNPMICANMNCSFCGIRQKNFSGKKGNVFYDEYITRLNEGVGMLPDEYITSANKGIRRFGKAIPIEIAEFIAQKRPDLIIEYARMKHSTDLFFHEYHNRYFRLDIKNIRAERRESRDLLQDLNDIQEGITVIHESDTLKKAKEQKRERRKNAQNKKVKKLKDLITKYGFENLDPVQKSKLRKLIRDGIVDGKNLEQWKSEFENQSVQLSLFE